MFPPLLLQHFIVAGIAMVTALAVMVMEASVICYLAFGIPLVVAPWAVVQRRLLNKAPTLRGQIAVCKEQAARLAQLNLHFGKENDRLGRQVQRFQQMQTQLNETVQRQGGDVQQVRALIKEHGKIQKQMAVRTLRVEIVWTWTSLTFFSSNCDNDRKSKGHSKFNNFSKPSWRPTRMETRY